MNRQNSLTSSLAWKAVRDASVFGGVHVNTPDKLKAASDELFDLVLKKKIKALIDQQFSLEESS
jgi:hypothetical protein